MNHVENVEDTGNIPTVRDADQDGTSTRMDIDFGMSRPCRKLQRNWSMPLLIWPGIQI